VSRPTIPSALTRGPFLATDAVNRGLLTRRQLQGASWLRVLPGVYTHSAHAMSYRDRCVAASLYLGDRGVVSGRSAAFMWGTYLTPESDECVEVNGIVADGGRALDAPAR